MQFNTKTPASLGKFFVSAALYNWVIGTSMLLGWQWFLPLLDTTPPDNPVFLHLFAWLVMVFGLAYCWIGCCPDPAGERSLIMLGAIAKTSVFLVIAYYYLLGLVGWPLALLAVGDQLYACAFLYYRRCLGKPACSLTDTAR